jgi:splicing factor 45
VNGFYAGEKRQRGGRKRRKKNKEEHSVIQDWDDIYDPSRPNSYEEYKHSDEKIREVREWKDRLYAHREARKFMSDKDSDDEDDYRPQMNSKGRSRLYWRMLTGCRPICAASQLLLCATTDRHSSSKSCG